MIRRKKKFNIFELRQIRTNHYDPKRFLSQAFENCGTLGGASFQKSKRNP